MIPVVGIVPTTATNAWGFIEGDFNLRLQLISHEWATEHRKAWNAVFAEGRKRGNPAYSASALVEMEIADADKRAEWSFETCSEIWAIQGGVRCRAFFRAIFDWCLTPMFAARAACFEHEFDSYQTRTHSRISQDPSAILGHFKREMMRLRAKWNTKLEIETRNATHEERRREREALQAQAAAPLALYTNPIKDDRKPTPSIRVPKKLTKAETQRRAVIFGAIQSNLEGLKYCKQLDRLRLRIPTAWIDDGCPDTYAKAYSPDIWRQRIHNEKYRYGKKYKQASPTQRENLIQQVLPARATRQ